VAYGQILSQEVLDIPELMPVNIHASLLPRYRGAAPINWAIINGDKKTGVTIMYVTAKMDAGPAIAQKEIEIEDKDTALILEDKLSICGAQLLMVALEAIEKRDYCLTEQQEEEAVYAPKLKKDTGVIDWTASAVNIHNQIKGLHPWPGGFTTYRKKMLKIFSTQVLPVFPSHKPLPGEVIRADQHGIVVACGRGFLEVKELQLEAGKRMPAQSFISGHKLVAGEVLGKK
jgi:methionyl-tRNA formyltransferase